jgi:hypothetical protein
MSPELVAIWAAISAETARATGMQAKNMQRLVLGESMAYDEQDFNYIAAALDRLSVQARNAQ